MLFPLFGAFGQCVDFPTTRATERRWVHESPDAALLFPISCADGAGCLRAPAAFSCIAASCIIAHAAGFWRKGGGHPSVKCHRNGHAEKNHDLPFVPGPLPKS